MIDQYFFVLQWAGLAIALLVGLILAVMRPYWAFLFATFVVLAFSTTTLAFTRAEDVGAYFNLYDACFVVSLFAYIMDQERKVLLPAPVLAILAVLAMGVLNTYVTIGITYGVLRAIRYAITLPLQFILTAGLVREEARVKSLLIVLLLAAVTAELQHLAFVRGASETIKDPDFLRTVQFTMAGSEIWLLTGPYLVGGSLPHPWLQMAAGALFLAANISHQTRSVALAFTGALLVYYLWFLGGPNSFRWQRFKLLFFTALAGGALLSVVGLFSLTSSFGERLLGSLEWKNPVHSGLETREKDFRIEFNDWLNGNIFIGRGLCYYAKKISSGRYGPVAWGHLGYVTYLSQLGLFGFVVYGFWFPLSVLRRARRIVKSPKVSPVLLYLGLFTGACFIIQPLTYVMSGSYLARLFLPGILGGALWGNTSTQTGEAAPEFVS